MKVVVFSYTQSGQALEIAQSICQPIAESGIPDEVVYKAIVPRRHYPKVWSRHEFFDVFPETRLGIPPCGIEVPDLDDVQDADLVMVAGQTWFLSPSQPIQAFFLDERIKAFLRGRDVIFVNGCRNMWLMTLRKVRQYIADAGARMVGHIVLQDDVPNLVSVITIIRWLIYGKREATRLWPRAGVTESDVADAARFGCIILQAHRDGRMGALQEQLMQAGAIKYKPSVLFLEKLGHRMFWLWATFIRRGGESGNPKRRWRCTLFFVYLLTVLYLVSPFGWLFFQLTYPLHPISRQRREDCYRLET